ncbi:MAG: methyl-accepting chemotaxis protein [Pseudomonadota bacterium]
MSKRPGPFATIRSRLVFGSLGLVAVPLLLATATIGWLADRGATEALTRRASEQLDAIAAVKRGEIEAYFGEVASNLRVVAETPTIRDALRDLPGALAALPASIPTPDAERRAALKAYWGGDFEREFRRRNADAEAAIAAQVDDLPADAVAAQYLYIAGNLNPLGRKNILDDAGDGSAYSRLHAVLQPYARNLLERYGYYDVFLVEPDGGRVVYTYFKELDFATSLNNGPWAGSGLAEAFAMARDNVDRRGVTMADFKPYVPSYNDQAAFVSTPVTDGDVLLGVLVVQLPVDRVNAVMSFGRRWAESGMGSSGEAYLVGADKVSRSIARFLVEDPQGYVEQLRGAGVPAATIDQILLRNSSIGLQPVDTRGVAEALAGRSGVAFYPDYRGVPILGSYAPIEVLGNPWAIVAEIDEAEALGPVAEQRRRIALGAAATASVRLLLGLLFANRLARSINAPVTHIQGVVQQVAAGQTDARTRMTSTDELGVLGRAFDSLLDERVSSLVRAEQENEQLNDSVISILEAVGQIALRDLTIKAPVRADVTGAVSDAINLMASETASTLRQVQSISNQVAKASAAVRQRSDEVGAVAERSGTEAQAAAQELAAAAQALRTIADQAAQANQNAERAIQATGAALGIVEATVNGISASREQIRETEKRVKRLGERSQEISSVVGIISQIAERTSVLALNASMQAVAAGEAGRGFAVVADEVKRLAENARQATQQIATLVNAIQADTVETIQAMNGTIAQVVDISRLAETAGDQMGQTRDATGALVEAVRSISSTTSAQAEASDLLLARARQLQAANQETLARTAEQKRETGNLLQYADDLLAAVQVFRLPGA